MRWVQWQKKTRNKVYSRWHAREAKETLCGVIPPAGRTVNETTEGAVPAGYSPDICKTCWGAHR